MINSLPPHSSLTSNHLLFKYFSKICAGESERGDDVRLCLRPITIITLFCASILPVKFVHYCLLLQCRFSPEVSKLRESAQLLAPSKSDVSHRILQAFQTLRLAANKGPRPSQLVLGAMLRNPDHVGAQLLVERLYDATQ